jgi:hypothetical protein
MVEYREVISMGFDIQGAGRLEIVNSTIILGKGSIAANSPNAEIIVSEGSKVYVNGGSVSIKDGASLIFEFSKLELEDSHFVMDNSGTVEFDDRSSFITKGETYITGTTTGFSDDPGQGLYVHGDFTIITDVFYPGDRLVFNRLSTFNFGSETIIKKAVGGDKWDGIFVNNIVNQNSRFVLCRLNANVSGIHYIRVSGVHLNMDDAVGVHSKKPVFNSSHFKHFSLCLEILYLEEQ